jgi:hypothetical protein
MPERPKGADCKSAGVRLRRFKSFSPHRCGNLTAHCPLSSVVEHFHGKEGVPGSSPGGGSGDGPSVTRPEARPGPGGVAQR